MTMSYRYNDFIESEEQQVSWEGLMRSCKRKDDRHERNRRQARAKHRFNHEQA